VHAVGQVLGTIVWLYLLVLIGRLVFDYVQIFARSWEPRGLLLVVVEAIYTLTDPPLRLLRRVIPPIRMGQVSFDLAFIVLFLLLSVLASVLYSL